MCSNFVTLDEPIYSSLNIDQALDMRDAISKVLYVSLFTWLIHRINHIVYKSSPTVSSRNRIRVSILDMFGHENLIDNNFEQLCINFASESLYQHYTRCVFKLEQAEYAREKIPYINITFPDNQPLLNLIAKKPIGILPLLEDESNFPKATDTSFAEKCHYNHALNDLYIRSRTSGVNEFAIKHFEGTVWYNVEGFLEKNRNMLKSDVIELLTTCKMPIMNRIFHYAREVPDAGQRQVNRIDGRFVTIKPRTPTVSARFQEQLGQLFESVSSTNAWFIRCVRPNNLKQAMIFNNKVVYDQLVNSALVQTVQASQAGYAVRMKYSMFVHRYHSLLADQLPRGTASKEICRIILEKKINFLTTSSTEDNLAPYKFGFSKVFLTEQTECLLEKERELIYSQAAIRIQSSVRAYLARRRFLSLKRNVVRIQTAYRGYRQRKTFGTLKKGVTRLQATYRMKKQRREFEQIRQIQQRQQEEAEKLEKIKAANVAAAAAAVMAAQNAALKSNSSRPSSAEETNKKFENLSSGNSLATEVTESVQTHLGFDHLQLPHDLVAMLNDITEWKCVHSYNDIVKMVKSVLPLKPSSGSLRLPSDIDSHSFPKFANIYFRLNSWHCRKDPIKQPFLPKNSDKDSRQSLAIFQLILRFQHDHTLSGKKEKLVADYICQAGLANPAIRDEILCQLTNQTWKCDDEDAAHKCWLLMAHCLASFMPSPLLYKYLLKYVSDEAPLALR